MTQQVGGEGIVLPAMASIKKGKFYTVPYHVVSFPTKPESCRYEDLLPYYQGSMKNTSAWANTYLDRDHHAPREKDDAAE